MWSKANFVELDNYYVGKEGTLSHFTFSKSKIPRVHMADTHRGAPIRGFTCPRMPMDTYSIHILIEPEGGGLVVRRSRVETAPP